MLRRTASLLILAALAACGTPAKFAPPPQESLSLNNAALIVGKTVGTDMFGKRTGLRTWFRNLDAGHYFDSASGSMWGHVKQPTFAIFVTPGKISLNAIFAYDGALGAADSPLTVDVKAGEVLYVGTLGHSFERSAYTPQAPMHAHARYGKLMCPGLVFCEGQSESQSPDARARPPFATVWVLDEWPEVEVEIRKDHPEVPTDKIRKRLFSN